MRAVKKDTVALVLCTPLKKNTPTLKGKLSIFIKEADSLHGKYCLCRKYQNCFYLKNCKTILGSGYTPLTLLLTLYF
jgi:hypothetical protein